MTYTFAKRGLALTLWCILSATASAQALTKVTIGISSPSLPAAGSKIANELGLFKKHGLEVKLTQLESASVATMALISGSVDFTSASPSDVVLAQARGQKLVAVTNVYRSFAGVVVLSKAATAKLSVNAQSPVAQRLKALDGLLIASPSATSPYSLALKAASEGAGAAVRFTYMAQPAMVAALETGAIQGFISSSPFYVKPVLNDTGVIWISGPGGDFPPLASQANSQTLNTKQEYAAANPDVIRRMRAVFIDLSKTVEQRPGDVKAAITRLFPELDARTMELLFKTEAHGFRTGGLTAPDMAREIAFVRLANAQVAGLDKLDPGALLAP